MTQFLASYKEIAHTDVIDIVRDIALILKPLHEMSIVHRKLTLESFKIKIIGQNVKLFLG